MSGLLSITHYLFLAETLTVVPFIFLQVYAEEARVLIQEIDTALSVCSNVFLSDFFHCSN